MRYSINPFMMLLFYLPSKLYGLIIGIRNFLYDKNFIGVYTPECTVISVGNLTVGGTGKTPFVIFLSRHFSGKGRKVTIVSRGYGGSKSSSDVLTVSDGKGKVFVGADECGDEPFLLASSLPAVSVLVSKIRAKAIREAQRTFSPDIIILDDGYQHRAVSRTVDILLIDASDPFGNYQLLPSGMLREPIRNIQRADLIIITRAEENEEFITLERIIRTHNRDARIFKSGHSFSELLLPGTSKTLTPSELKGKKAYAFCAIGNPDIFIMDIERSDADIVGTRFYRDHHRYSSVDLETIERDALSAGAEILLTTQKDVINMASMQSRYLPLYSAQIRTVVHESERFFNELETMLANRRS